jgi:hypothetical protein
MRLSREGVRKSTAPNGAGLGTGRSEPTALRTRHCVYVVVRCVVAQ